MRPVPSQIFCAVSEGRELIGAWEWSGYSDLIALRPGAFRQTGARSPSGWSATDFGSAEYCCDACAGAPNVDQSFAVRSLEIIIVNGGPPKSPHLPTPVRAEYVRMAASAFPGRGTEI